MFRLYAQASDVSERMLASAHESDWDEVLRLGGQYQSLVDGIRALGDMAALDDAQRARKYALLLRLIENDAQIRDLAVPSLQRLGALINTLRHQHVLGKAYGQGEAVLR
ncbi:flagellar protein FliT [Verticiella sediminum]|uniref:Flagellar protein FliT n=2 Tax=Verticiella sediminum TaxID=1247510 RepID=A0A556ASB0_9BURK|nr:flagellar protein FliT [Verticiella sediminum]